MLAARSGWCVARGCVPTLPAAVLVVVMLLTACTARNSDVTADPPSPEAPEATTSGDDDPVAADDGNETADGAASDDDSGDTGGRGAADDEGPAPEVLPRADPDLAVALRLTGVWRMRSPTAGAVGPNGTLYLAERTGTVHPVVDGEIGPAVVDLTGDTTVESERGLLGIAFSEDGAEFYASYTNVAGDSVLAAYPVSDGEIDPDGRREVAAISQPFSNHNGGHVAIGPDGFLYWGLGDGGGAGDARGSAQNLATPLGSLLRIDPQSEVPYGVPTGNPFVGVEGAHDEIWAYGLRNPWRFSFDDPTGTLWIADVGQQSQEEINRIPADEAGANFGWNLLEGTARFAGAGPQDSVAPIHVYPTSSSRCAITGGQVYRGRAIPELVGAYLFSDFCEGRVRAITVGEDGTIGEEADLGLDGGNVVSFVEGPDGELYVLDLGGAVSRIDPAT